MLGLSRAGSPRLRTALCTVAAVSLLGSSVAVAASRHVLAITSGTGNGSEGANTIVQSSATGGAFQAQTGTTPDTSVPYPFALFGEYNANGATTFGIGVVGVSTTGYAVGAESIGPNAAIYATNPSKADGIDGVIGATDANNTAIAAVHGDSTGQGEFGVWGQDMSANSGTGTAGDYGTGVYGTSKDGFGGYFLDASGNQTNTNVGGGMAQLGLSDGRGGVFGGTSGNVTYPVVKADSFYPGTALFIGQTLGADKKTTADTFFVLGTSANRSGSIVPPTSNASDVEANGDLYLTGSVYTHCASVPVTGSTNCVNTASAAIAHTSTGQDVQTYASSHAQPTMEDEGEARVVGGTAHVMLDPAYAATISRDTPYMVFVTPEGDSGLYVTNKTPTSFDVRSIGGGRATLAFSYRVVAHPFGDRSTRLAIVPRHVASIANSTQRGDLVSFDRLIAKTPHRDAGPFAARFSRGNSLNT